MFSVGVLYSCTTFLRLVQETLVTSSGFTKMFETFTVASPESILSTSQACEWITLNKRGEVLVTPRGVEILAGGSEAEQLRIQIRHLITSTRPQWAPVLATGRREAEKALPAEVQQCFREAGLLDGYEEHVLSWWEKAASVGRLLKDEKRSETGRSGERLSLDYEAKRTHKEPYWQGFESNFAGYDILSKVDDTSEDSLLIEVKSSHAKPREGNFFLTRHEWDVALSSRDYVFHLWAMKPEPKLFVVKRDEAKPHVPTDAGAGKWRQVLIPFEPFVNGVAPASKPSATKPR